MDSSDFSSALYACLQLDLGVVGDPQGSRFDPFPNGRSYNLSVDRFARESLLISVFKKTEVESDALAEENTLSEFLTANAACASQTRDGLLKHAFEGDVGYAISNARNYLDTWFARPCADAPAITMASIEVAAGFGPGRSVGMGSKPNGLYFKVGDSPLTAGSEFVRSWYKLSVSHNPVCEAAEMARTARWGEPLVCEYGNLALALKSYLRRRITITEPSASTYFQLGLGRCMEGVLSREVGINFSDEPHHNAQLAKEGSMFGTYATVDLKQCSDYISKALVGFMFPKTLTRWFRVLRTGFARISPSILKAVRGSEDQRESVTVPLHMCSTMGNGFTFPMQTALLAAIVLGVYKTLGLERCSPAYQNGVLESRRDFGVFGDDIVIRTEAYDLLCRVLSACGLVVNFGKSFAEGNFRESCGHDYYCGQDVRGVYIKRYTRDQDLFSAFNRLAQWSAKHNQPLVRTLSFILHSVEGVIPLIPPDLAVTQGIRTPTPPIEPDENGMYAYWPYVPKLKGLKYDYWTTLQIGGLQQGAKAWKRFQAWLGDLMRYCDGSINEPAALKVLLAGGVRRSNLFDIKEGDLTYALARSAHLTPRWGYSEDGTFPRLGTVEFDRLDSIVEFAIGSFIEE